jgi:pimeloyl-ACP methyl ester carboxylesterase
MKRILALLLLCGPAACTGAHPGDDFFWFENANAEMPVWVRGQVDSGTFVIYLQGGPGNPTQMIDAMFPEMTPTLDERYAMVYYDQRASGISAGNASEASMTPEQFADDLDVLIDILEERYTVDHLFLWGISWGGTLGNQYLSTDNRQDRVDGWIEMAGGENQVLGYQVARPQVMEHARDQIALGDRVSHWEGALDYYESNPERLPPPPDNLAHYNYVFDAGGYFFDPADGFDSFVPYLFQGPFSLTTYLANQAFVDRVMDVDSQNLHPRMADITIPALLMWGREDLVVPVEVGQASYDALGTPEADKTLLIFDDTSHTVPNEAPAQSLEAMDAFIQDIVSR